MPARVLVFGSINMDLVIQSARIPAAGETVLGGMYFESPGGKGANQAVAAARAGALTTLVARVGDDHYGQKLLTGLRAETIDCEYVIPVGNTSTGVALIMVDAAGENCISVASGANASLTPDEVNRLPDDLFAQASVVLANLEIPLATATAAMRRAREHKLITVLNPAPATIELNEAEIWRYVDIVTPNQGEAALISDLPGDVDDFHRRAGRAFAELGCPQTVITLGAEGVATAGDVARTYPGHTVNAVDATGAGDAFNGWLAAGLAHSAHLADAIEFANAAAALACTAKGAQASLPTREEVAAFRNQINA